MGFASDDPTMTAKAKLIARIDRLAGDDGCWLWQGAQDERGYGRVRFDGRIWSTHRLAYWAWFQELEDWQLVLHHCDEQRCVRPSHLYAGTHRENAQDRQRRHLSIAARRTRSMTFRASRTS